MRLLQNIVSEAVEGFRNMLFPGVCLACGEPDIDGVQLLCPFCVENQFDAANPYLSDACPGVILPESVGFQHAMWKYDKGGVLQKLLHGIKYSGLGRLGYELGYLAGQTMRMCPSIDKALEQPESVVLLPVPLHPRRKRMRGFNQAEVIALGVSGSAEISLVPEGAVVRSRYTSTQTGFSLMDRSENLSGVFQVVSEQELQGKTVIIVDDVFTTGATTFALAEEISKCGVDRTGILTIAQA